MTVLSVQPTTMREWVGCGSKVTARGRQVPISKGRVSAGLFALPGRHRRMARSSGRLTANASISPSGEKATPVTASVSVCGNCRLCFHVAVSHRRTVLSALPVASSLPSGLKARPEIHSPCSFRLATGCWSARLQTRTTASVPPGAKVL